MEYEVKIYILNFKKTRAQKTFNYYQVVLEFSNQNDTVYYQASTIGIQLKYKKMNAYKKVESIMTEDFHLIRDNLFSEHISCLGDSDFDILTLSKDDLRIVDIVKRLIFLLSNKRFVTTTSGWTIGFTDELVKILKRKIPKD